MKPTLRVMFPVLLLLYLATAAFGQHTLFLKAPTTATNLSDIIMGDTTANGARVDTQRVYVLQRGGTWFWNNIVTNAGWPLNIVASDTGVAEQPRVYAMPVPNATPLAVPYQFVNVEGNVYVKGITMVGYFDQDTSYLDNYGATYILFRCATPGWRMEFVGNTFGGTNQAFASNFAAGTTIKFTDNILVNSNVPWSAGAGNGRVVDARNISLDSLVMINNTVAYGFDRVMRHRSSVGRINHIIFDHNTVYENGGRYGLFTLGAVGSDVTITNSLFVDPMAMGADTNSQRQYDFIESNEFDAQGKVVMSWINYAPLQTDTLPGFTPTQWKIAHNYYYTSPSLTAAWDTARAEGWDPTLGFGRILSDSIKARLGADTATAFTALSNFAFNKVPAPFSNLMLWFAEPTSMGGAEGGDGSGLQATYPGYDIHTTPYYRDTMSAAYSTASPAYTGAWGGFPAGDLNWYPSAKATWATTAVKAANTTVPNKFSLEQNYPNPFNPSTQIKFNLGQPGMMSLKVYNLLGQMVQVVDEGQRAAGEYTYNVDMSRFASGVYFYRLEQGTNVLTKKMLLLK
ncbi:MAG TPA: T9SS type A sorting domain-containing protein [Bacteroidota bacterium]|nr:T9SS type A sorting domain-containing protein [Bacteroidota bacterium]